MGLSPFALYNAIYDDVGSFLPEGFQPSSSIPPGSSYKRFTSCQLLRSLLKKWQPDRSDSIDRLSWDKFLNANQRCESWEFRPDWEVDRELYGNFCRELEIFFFPNGQELFSSYFDFLEAGRTGPGAAIGASGGSLYAKLFSSPLTSTSQSLYKIYKNFIAWYPTFEQADCQRSSNYGNLLKVDGSRVSFVPKTDAVSRMICVEPSLNMVFQLGLGAVLEKRLRDLFKIDLSTQPLVNRQLARAGSLVDGTFCTIDLESASDSVSLALCKAVLPRYVFNTISELRSPYTTYKGSRVPLNMVSTMGNGFTFPLQTIIFSCIIRAAYVTYGVPIWNNSSNLYANPVNWACFGDDLIVDKRCLPLTLRLLSLLGFRVNPSKSFFEGPFRESCGADWFNGRPCRGVYIRRLSSLQDLFVAINLLNGWSAYTGIPLKRGVSLLLASVGKNFLAVPFEENIDAGVRVPSILIDKINRDSNGSYLYKCRRMKPLTISIKDGALRVPMDVKDLIYNPSGLWISFLYGELAGPREGVEPSWKINVRHDIVHYRTKVACTPRWDYIPTGNLVNGARLSWQQWVTAVLHNVAIPLRK